MNSRNGSWNTVEDPFGRVCFPEKIEVMNLEVFNIIKGINESQKPHVIVDVNLMIKTVTQDNNGTMISISVSEHDWIPKRLYMHEKSFGWSSCCICRDCVFIGKYMNIL